MLNKCCFLSRLHLPTASVLAHQEPLPIKSRHHISFPHRLSISPVRMVHVFRKKQGCREEDWVEVGVSGSHRLRSYPESRREEGSGCETSELGMPGASRSWETRRSGVWARRRRAAAPISCRQPVHRSPSSPLVLAACAQGSSGRGRDTGQSSTARRASPECTCPSSADPALTLLPALPGQYR
jgi:hypothetical protein